MSKRARILTGIFGASATLLCGHLLAVSVGLRNVVVKPLVQCLLRETADYCLRDFHGVVKQSVQTQVAGGVGELSNHGWTYGHLVLPVLRPVTDEKANSKTVRNE